MRITVDSQHIVDLESHAQNYSHIIWDWNGTLLDDAHLAASVVSEQLAEHGLDELHIERYREVFGFPVRDYYQRVGFDFSRTSFTDLGDRFIQRYYERIDEVKLFPGVRHWLESNKKNGRQQSILSAAKQAHLEQWLPHFDIHHLFDHICGIADHYAGSKLQRGKELIANSNVSTAKTLMIGDTDHDCEVAKELGIDVLLIADGHQSHERLLGVHDRVLASRFVRD